MRWPRLTSVDRFHDCANAVGAAIAKVSGTVDIIKVLEGVNEDEIVEAVCEEAKKRAVDAGADPATVKIIELDNMPLEYVQMRASRIIAKAAGPLGRNALASIPKAGEAEDIADDWFRPAKKSANAEKDAKDFIVSPSALIDIREYKPEVDRNGTWWVSETDLEFLATGCSILACGGGGPGYMCYLAARAALKAGHRLSVVDVDALPEDEYIAGTISYGQAEMIRHRNPANC